MPVPEAVVIGVYVMADEFQAAALPPVPRTGGQRPALHRSEVLTLALLAQLGCFPSERAFWRFADAEWRHLFPRLPHRSQLNRAVRAQRAASGVYLADTGFAGRAARARWAALGADVLAPPQRDSRERWPRAWRALHQRRRQIVETVFARLHGPFRLERDRPRSLGGLLTRIAAKVALSNALIRLNRDAGRPGLTLAGLVI
jgi:hypothetical protein